jgi:hypothetical protein
VEPISIATAAASVLGPMLRAPAMPAGPAISGGAPMSSIGEWDFSGFTVATGSGKATGAPNNKTTTQSPTLGAGVDPMTGAAPGGGAMVAGFSTTAMLGVAAFGLAALLLLMPRRGRK